MYRSIYHGVSDANPSYSIEPSHDTGYFFVPWPCSCMHTYVLNHNLIGVYVYMMRDELDTAEYADKV